MKTFDHLKESKCLSDRQNLKTKVAFLSLSENEIAAEQEFYLGSPPWAQTPLLTPQMYNTRFPRGLGHWPALAVAFLKALIHARQYAEQNMKQNTTQRKNRVSCIEPKQNTIGKAFQNALQSFYENIVLSNQRPAWRKHNFTEVTDFVPIENLEMLSYN